MREMTLKDVLDTLDNSTVVRNFQFPYDYLDAFKLLKDRITELEYQAEIDAQNYADQLEQAKAELENYKKGVKIIPDPKGSGSFKIVILGFIHCAGYFTTEEKAKEYIEKTDLSMLELLPVEAENKRLKLERDSLKQAGNRIMLEPHGCPFCHSGKQINPKKSCLDACGFKMMKQALQGGEE